ncbi:MAG: hypothetical protein H6728_01230 [Myxococcales bacterium]|nr:hypothetical protein [Myxococcales bacterium]
MDRYMLGVMSLEEQTAFESRLAWDEVARAQFARFREMWEEDRFDRLHQRVVFPPESQEHDLLRRSLRFARWGMGFAAFGLLLWTGSTWWGGPLGTQRRVHPFVDGGSAEHRVVPKRKKPHELKKAEPLGALPKVAMQPKGANPHASPTKNVEPALVVALRRGEKTVQARSGQRFVSGDRLRLAYRWRQGEYVFLAHQEGEKVTPLFPRKLASESRRIEDDGLVLLPGSLEVSGDSASEEWLVACFSTRPLSWNRFQQGLVSFHKKVDVHPLRECSHVVRFLIRRE